jgi:hypothetical protein
MDLFKIAADLAAIETNISLDEEANLRARVEALDLLDFLAQIVRLRGRQEDLRALGQRVAAQRRRLERVNQHLFEKARGFVPGVIRPKSCDPGLANIQITLRSRRANCIPATMPWMSSSMACWDLPKPRKRQGNKALRWSTSSRRQRGRSWTW